MQIIILVQSSFDPVLPISCSVCNFCIDHSRLIWLFAHLLYSFSIPEINYKLNYVIEALVGTYRQSILKLFLSNSIKNKFFSKGLELWC